MNRWVCLPLYLCLMSVPVLAVAAEQLESPAGPIEVTSMQMEADQQTNSVEFVGEVVAKRGSMTVYAERLTLFFVETGAGRRIEHLEASGAVRVVEGDRVATANRLDYLQSEEKMTLSGDAKINQGDNLVAGDEITLFLRENRSLVKSGKDGRVKAVFLPQQEKP